MQNGFAIAGDYMSAASFLGIAGLIFLFGFDGFLYSVGFLVAFLTVLFLLSERMRNAGKFTIADVLSFRLNERPARVAAALGTLAVAALLPDRADGRRRRPDQRAGGHRFQRRGHRDRRLHARLRRLRRHARDDVGADRQGRPADDRRHRFSRCSSSREIGWNPIDIFDLAENAVRLAAASTSSPGLRFTEPIDTVSLGLALVLGTAGLPHILMRFFTVPDAKAARSSVGWAVALIGAFYVMTTFLGFGARAILGEAGTTGGVDAAGNLAAPLLAQEVGGGAGSIGGDAFLAIISAIAFATILAVVAGLVISASGAVAHDVWSNVIRKGKDSEHEEVLVARIAAFMIGAICDRDRGHRRLRPERLLHGRPGIRRGCERELPGAPLGAHVEAVQHHGRGLRRAARRRELDRDRSGRPRRDRSDPFINLTQPAIISVPLGFLGCILGSLSSKEESRAERNFEELNVRAETGLGAEIGRSKEPACEATGDEPASAPAKERVPAGRG